MLSSGTASFAIPDGFPISEHGVSMSFNRCYGVGVASFAGKQRQRCRGQAQAEFRQWLLRHLRRFPSLGWRQRRERMVFTSGAGMTRE